MNTNHMIVHELKRHSSSRDEYGRYHPEWGGFRLGIYSSLERAKAEAQSDASKELNWQNPGEYFNCWEASLSPGTEHGTTYTVTSVVVDVRE